MIVKEWTAQPPLSSLSVCLWTVPPFYLYSLPARVLYIFVWGGCVVWELSPSFISNQHDVTTVFEHGRLLVISLAVAWVSSQYSHMGPSGIPMYFSSWVCNNFMRPLRYYRFEQPSGIEWVIKPEQNKEPGKANRKEIACSISWQT